MNDRKGKIQSLRTEMIHIRIDELDRLIHVNYYPLKFTLVAKLYTSLH